MTTTHHEELYRSRELMRQLAGFQVTVCGAGALGANICESLARGGFHSLRVIDRDRIEERNLSTQPWERSDIGAFKARTLANTLYRAVGVELDARSEELSPDNARKLLAGSQLVLDCFDNSVARAAVKGACEQSGLECLHVGLASDYAEVVWSQAYRVPSASQDDVCDYPLARNLVTLTVSVACELVVRFVASGERPSVSITLGDFAVRPYAG